MKRLILALSLVITAATSAYLFKNSDEIRIEFQATKWSDVKKNKYLPFYLSSLYLGPVRGMLTNSLWLKYDKAREKRMYYECKELVEVLLLLQPRNEVIWQFLSREMAFNIPAIIPEHRRWEWVKNGFLKLHEGILALPNSILLKYQMMEDLYKKSLPIPGKFNEHFINNFINDDDLYDKVCFSKPCNPFNAAVEWGRIAYDQIKSGDRQMVYTDAGLIIHAPTIINFIRDIYLACGYWNWFNHKYENALDAFKLSLEEVESFRQKYPQFATMFHDRYMEALSELSRLVQHESRNKEPDIDERRKYLQKHPGMDESFIYSFLSENMVNKYTDYYEYNDDAIYAKMLPQSKIVQSMIIDSIDIDNYLVPSNILKKQRHITVKIKHTSNNNLTLQLYYLLDKDNEVKIWQKLVPQGEREFKISLREAPYILIRLSTGEEINDPINYVLMYYF